MGLKKILPFWKNDKTIIGINLRNRHGNNLIENNQIARTIINIDSDTTSEMSVKNLSDSISLSEASVEVKEKILPIEKLMNDGKTSVALEQFISLQENDEFTKYSKNEKFLVYNGILNCHVNMNSKNAEILKWSTKIEALGDVKEIHKYYYIKSVWKYNLGDLKEAKLLNESAIKTANDYINALSFAVLIKARLSEIGYDKAVTELNTLLERDLNAKDISRTFGILGDVSFLNQKFKEACEYYKESFEYVKGTAKELGIAISLYHISIKEIRPDGLVDFQNIDFSTLKESQVLLEKIYKEKTDDLSGYRLNMLISYLFNTYTMTGNINRILEIAQSDRDILDFSNAEIVRYVAQVQAINKVYDEEVFSHLDEYSYLKYKTFYLEQCEEYEEAYDLLLPAIEGKYSKDKLLRLGFLNCLHQLNDYKEYIRYYKKYQQEGIDEVLWMNFIEFLEDLKRIPEMISELKKISEHISNPFIVIAYMKMLSRNKLFDDLEIFFNKVDDGTYSIIDENKSMVAFERVMLPLKREEYAIFYDEYEKLDLDSLRDVDRLILTINYYNYKGDYSSSGKAYFELYELEKNPDDLLKAIQNKITANENAVAGLYLEYLNPMELEKPEMYYMLSAIILRERGKLKEAFDKLDEYKEYVEDLDSPFHQFYFGFNMSNGRLDEAMKYIGRYYAKNQNPKWFQVVKHEEDESAEAIIEKMKTLVGVSPDYSEINKFYIAGLIGISVYSKATNRKIEEVIADERYPLNIFNIAIEGIEVSMKRAEAVGDTILVDANTLIVLAKVNGLQLLDGFSKVLISQDTLSRVKAMEREFVKNLSSIILNYIETSLCVQIIPVDISLKDTSERTQIFPEDMLSCLALSESMGITFFNIEAYVVREFKPKHILDMNAFFLRLKVTNPEMAEKIALVKKELRLNRFNFISFDFGDLLNVYNAEGLEGIKPFVKLDKNSIYNTFLPQYINALIELEKSIDREEFEKVLAFFIQYFDKYLGKIKYYLANISRQYATLKSDADKVSRFCCLRTVFWFMQNANLSRVKLEIFRDLTGKQLPISELIETHNFIVEQDKDNKLHDIRKVTYERIQAVEYTAVLVDEDYQKVSLIFSFVAQFFVQVIYAFGTTEEKRNRILEIIEKNIILNEREDINYLIQLIEEVKEKDNMKDSQ